MSPPIIHRSRSPFKFRHETKEGKTELRKIPKYDLRIEVGVGSVYSISPD